MNDIPMIGARPIAVRPMWIALVAVSLWLAALAGACSGATGIDPSGDSVTDPSAHTPTPPTFEPGPAPGGLVIDRPSSWRAIAEDESLLILVGPDVTSPDQVDGDEAMFMAACGMTSVGETPEGAVAAFIESAAAEGFVPVEGPGRGALGALDSGETVTATLEYDGGDGAGNLIAPALRMTIAAAPGPEGQACFVMARGEQAAWDELGPLFERMMGSVRAAE